MSTRGIPVHSVVVLTVSRESTHAGDGVGDPGTP